MSEAGVCHLPAFVTVSREKVAPTPQVVLGGLVKADNVMFMTC